VPDDEVISERFPYLPIRLLVAGHSMDTEALLDTGFDGAVVMPADFFGTDALPDSHAAWALADGSEVVAPVFIGLIRVGHLEPIRAERGARETSRKMVTPFLAPQFPYGTWANTPKQA
jgi:hypothetical protein